MSLNEIRKEIRKQVYGYVIAAFSLVAGLAWNDAIKSLIEFFLPPSHGTLLAKFIYAVIITSVVVFASYFILRTHEKSERKN